MTQQSVRDVIDRLGIPVPYLKSLVANHGIPPIQGRSAEDWQRLERLLIEPPGLDVNGWTYFETYGTIVRLISQRGQKCLIQPPGLESRWVGRSLCHHPYSEVAGGAKRWQIETYGGVV